MKTKRVRQVGIQCPNCLQHLYSNYRHDFKYCWCGACMIDGGFDYMRCGWEEPYATRETTKSVSRYVYVTVLTEKETLKQFVDRWAY